ncbi:MAG: hypothetical protein C0502_02710 [Opitutus sp.]|nr:hypothetical protein [Opitutus sp.]
MPSATRLKFLAQKPTDAKPRGASIIRARCHGSFRHRRRLLEPLPVTPCLAALWLRADFLQPSTKQFVNTASVLHEQLLLTLKQAAQRLAISRRTLERLIASGDFPAPLKIGRASRVPVGDVNAYQTRLIEARDGINRRPA